MDITLPFCCVIKTCLCQRENFEYVFALFSIYNFSLSAGRTFPTHPYFMQTLGPGQLALFNVLKAYSLLDSDVGYCQGLSFVGGVLLLHVSIILFCIFTCVFSSGMIFAFASAF